MSYKVFIINIVNMLTIYMFIKFIYKLVLLVYGNFKILWYKTLIEVLKRGVSVEKNKNLEGSMNNDLTENNAAEINPIKLLGVIDRTVVLIEQVFDKFYKKFKLSKTQFSALYRIYLAGDEGITLSALGDQMFVTRANITTLVDRMVARGLIKRIVNESDRRSIKAVITNQGRDILQEVIPNNQVFSSEILNCLTNKEKERFHEFLLKIQKELIEIYNKY